MSVVDGLEREEEEDRTAGLSARREYMPLDSVS